MSESKKNDLGFSLFMKPLMKQRIVTCPEGVVTYILADDDPVAIIKQHINPDEKDKQIADILRANPDADFKTLEAALGVKILDIQRRPVPKPTRAAEPTEEKKAPPEWWT